MLGSIWTYQQMKKKSKIDGLEIWDLKSVYFELIFLCYFLLTNNYCCGKNKLEEIKNRLLEIKIGFEVEARPGQQQNSLILALTLLAGPSNVFL